MGLGTDILGCAVGVFGMVMAFFATTIRPALSFGRGPSYPISKSGRIIFFLAGMLVFTDCSARLLGHSGLGLRWRVAVPFVAVAVLVLLLKFKVVRAQTQKAQSGPTVAIDFGNGLPFAMVVARIGFFVIVVAMVAFGVGPIADSTAKSGIIGCVIALFVLALLYGALESHYVNTGRATVIRLRGELTDDRKDQP